MDLSGVNLEPTADPNITAHTNELVHQNSGDIANQYGSGINQARGLLNAPENFNASLGYGDKATTAAIRSRYSMPYQREENQLKLDNLKNAQSDHLRSLQVASQAAGQEVENNKQKAILKWKIDQANKKARGAVLGSILGIVGGVAGGVLGSGAGPAGTVAGAGAGMSLGEGVGNAIGGA